jgi:hypothetical protein
MLGGARAGEYTERRLELTENRRLTCCEAHVARQRELAARTAAHELARDALGL